MEGPIAAHAIEGRTDEAREALESALDRASVEGTHPEAK